MTEPHPIPDPDSPDTPEIETPPPGQIYRLAWILYLVLAVVGAIWVGWRRGSIPLELFIDLDGWWIDLGLGVGAGLLLIGVWEVARYIFPLARELERSIAKILSSVDVSEAVALAILSGFAEELFFRGAVQGAFASHGWFWAAILFAVLHTGSGKAFRLWTVFAFIAGVVLGLLMHWRGNLLAPVVGHMVVNGVNLTRIARQQSPEDGE